MASVVSSNGQRSGGGGNRTRSTTLTSSGGPPSTQDHHLHPSSVICRYQPHNNSRPWREFNESVILNPSTFPAARPSDIVRMSQPNAVLVPLVDSDGRKREPNKRMLEGVLFRFRPENLDELKQKAGLVGRDLQLSIPEDVDQLFSFQRDKSVTLEIVDPDEVSADFVELYFKDQYVGRSDMWRLGVAWEGKCIYQGQMIHFADCIVAEVKSIYRRKKRVASGYFTARTKTIFRSASAKYTIFLQVCRETYEFDEDGERYYEKAMHGFLPELFRKWGLSSSDNKKDNKQKNKKTGQDRKTKTNHVVTIILFSRVCYDQSEKDLIEGPLKKDVEFGYYQDFYKVVLNAEQITNPDQTIVRIKTELSHFQKLVLLDHHRRPGQPANILGSLSYAYQGNILEAVNLALNPFDSHHVDRDFTRTGFSLTVVTPGTGHFRVNKHLLRLTTERCTDHGLALDLVCLNKMPLHSVPLFSFLSPNPNTGSDGAVGGSAAKDPLLYDPPPGMTSFEQEVYYSVAFWVYCSFWSKSTDRRYRPGRFLPRVKMSQIQSLGVLNHDLSTILLPLLDDDKTDSRSLSTRHRQETPSDRRRAQEDFDHDIFERAAPDQNFAPTSYNSSTRHVRSTTPTSHNSMSYSSNSSSQLAGSHPSADFRSRLPSSSLSPAQPSVSALSASLGRNKPSILSSSPPNQSSDPPPVSEPLRPPPPSPPRPKSRTHSKPEHHFPEPTFSKRAIIPQPPSTPSSLALRPVTAAPPTLSVASRIPSYSSAKTITSLRSHDTPAATITPPSPTTFTGEEPLEEPKKRTLVSRLGFGLLSPFIQRSPLSTNTFTPPPPAPPALPPPLPAPVPPKLDVKQSSAATIKPARTPDDSASSSLRVSSPIAISTPGGRGQSNAQTPNGSVSSAAHGGSRLGASGASASQSYRDTKAPDVQRMVNPCNPNGQQLGPKNESHRWQYILPRGAYRHQIKWKSLTTPGSLPITTNYLPSVADLKSQYLEREIGYPMIEFEESPFIVLPPDGVVSKTQIVKEMALQRLAQGFQVVVSNNHASQRPKKTQFGRPSKERPPLPGGASEALRTSNGSIWLSLSNQIHRIDYNEDDDSIRVMMWTKKEKYSTDKIEYEGLVWPCLASGFSPVKSTFSYPSERLKSFQWNKLDSLVSGVHSSLDDSITYWRARFVVVPSGEKPTALAAENLTTEEVLLEGAHHLAELFERARWVSPFETTPSAPVRFLPTTRDPSISVRDEVLMDELDLHHSHRVLGQKSKLVVSKLSTSEVATILKEGKGAVKPLHLRDLAWGLKIWPEAFAGDELVTWLQENFRDLKNRETALEYGSQLFDEKIFLHVHRRHALRDGNYLYQLSPGRPPRSSWFGPQPASAPVTLAKPLPVTSTPIVKKSTTNKNRRRKILMSNECLLNLDPAKKSDRSEPAWLNYDAIHNPKNGFHFEFSWCGVTSQLVESLVGRWAKGIQQYGLRIVEAPSEQISEISKRSAFRSCVKVPLALAHPTPEEYDPNLPLDHRPSSFFFEAFLLREQGFVLDIESDANFSSSVDVQYHRKTPQPFSQWVHRSGLAFVQATSSADYFNWLDNQQFTETKMEASNATSPITERMAKLRSAFVEFCANEEKLRDCYERAIQGRELEKEETLLLAR